ncbi:early nodulin-like protein 6 [Gastrolobium bilobum]|uniref:early nodulin-like protein 6 n=1 Tax=Gastrolobium bilobum TaxID=150636 RepID=UPI002AB15CE0|nr:early nodulin-like protein 6 [Gastrolobium bilobum]
MVALFKTSYPLFLCFILFYLSHVLLVNCTEFEVGDLDGWVVPKSKDNDEMYNQWASQNRFKVNDTVRFMFNKDSVMVVTEEEYGKCRSSRPVFFSNNGDTVFKFDRPGLFYFISGVSGHCDRGQKMIIKVLDVVPATPPQLANESAKKSHSTSEVAEIITPMSITTSTLFVLLFLGLLHA